MIISAPFGNYLTLPGCTSTIGTFTAAPRPGRWWQVAKTVRYNRRQQSWINKIGLRNPGIGSITYDQSKNKIISIHGFNADEWYLLTKHVERLQPIAVEFNVSCPNVGEPSWHELPLSMMKRLIDVGKIVIVKLPPVDWMRIAKPCWEAGVRDFHCCNTIPTPGGGISGKPLMQYSLWCVREMRATFPNAYLIGGGGVTTLDDVTTYMRAGATDVAIGSVLFNPFKWKTFSK